MITPMSQISTTEVTRLVEALSADERLALIDQLWSSLADADVPLTAAQQVELRRRLDSFDADLADAQPWGEVEAALAREQP